MQNYNTKSFSGEKFTRYSRVVIENTLNQIPVVNCVEEDVVELEGRQTCLPTGNLVFEFDPEYSFPVLDDVTGEPTSTFRQASEVYLLIYSYMIAKAKERDTA